MGVRLKRGVSVRGLQPEMIFGIQIASGFFERNKAGDVVITSAVDGEHSRGSLHYVGYAIDVRIWAIEKDRLSWFADELDIELGTEFDCVLEKDHLHIEFQPKEKLND